MKQRISAAVGVATIVALALVGTAFASAEYYWNWLEAPKHGNHWWNNGTYATRTAEDYWSTDHLNQLQYGHRVYGIEYQIENEAYKPPSSYCDRLHIVAYSTQGLPVTGWISSNGCGNASTREELKVLLDEDAMSANTWYRHTVQYSKVQCAYPNEVNYSFSHSISPSDDWLGKINLDSACNRLNSDPPGMVN